MPRIALCLRTQAGRSERSPPQDRVTPRTPSKVNWKLPDTVITWLILSRESSSGARPTKRLPVGHLTEPFGFDGHEVVGGAFDAEPEGSLMRRTSPLVAWISWRTRCSGRARGRRRCPSRGRSGRRGGVGRSGRGSGRQPVPYAWPRRPSHRMRSWRPAGRLVRTNNGLVARARAGLRRLDACRTRQ